MNALEAAALVLLIMLPLHLLVQRELRRLSDPGDIRAHGVTVESETVIRGSSTSPIRGFKGTLSVRAACCAQA